MSVRRTMSRDTCLNFIISTSGRSRPGSYFHYTLTYQSLSFLTMVQWVTPEAKVILTEAVDEFENSGEDRPSVLASLVRKVRKVCPDQDAASLGKVNSYDIYILHLYD